MGLSIQLHGVVGRHPAALPSLPPALKALTWAVAPGEQVAVIGPSGAGKTTLLHLLACALRPAAGVLQLDGVDPWALSTAALQKLRGKLFLAPQTPPLPARQRVITTLLAARLPRLSLWQSLRALFYPDDIAGAHAALVEFDLPDKLWDRVDRLSGGERQRVALARAVLAPAALWLIDEPLSALDPTRARQVIDVLRRTAQARGVTLVAALHQVEMAARFPRVIGLREGELMFDGPGSALTPARLAALYAQHEEALHEAAPIKDDAPTPCPPAAMVCR